MTIEEALTAHLTANAGLAALLGTRVYPKVLPQGPAFPSVVYHVVSAVSEHHQTGNSQNPDVRVQIDAFALTYAQAKAVSDLVFNALDSFAGMMGGAGGVEVYGVFAEDARDGYDDEHEVFVLQRDFMISHYRPGD